MSDDKEETWDAMCPVCNKMHTMEHDLKRKKSYGVCKEDDGGNVIQYYIIPDGCKDSPFYSGDTELEPMVATRQ